MTLMLPRVFSLGWASGYYQFLLFAVSLTSGTASFAAVIAESGGAAQLGWLAALVGAAQLTSRAVLLTVLRRWRSGAVMNFCVGMQALAFVLPAVAPTFFALLISAILQGWSRGWYWTTANTEAAENLEPGRGVATIGFMSSAGALVAPAILLVVPEFRMALLNSGLVSLLAMRRRSRQSSRLQPAAVGRSSSGDSPRRLLLLPGVGLSLIGGALHSVALTFVPALAVTLELESRDLGLLMFAVSLSAVSGTVAVRTGLITARGRRYVFIAIMVILGFLLHASYAGIGTLAVAAVLASMGGGVFMLIGPVATASQAPASHRARGMIMTSTSRSAALLSFPVFVAALTLVLSLQTALVVSLVFAIALGLWMERGRRAGAHREWDGMGSVEPT